MAHNNSQLLDDLRESNQLTVNEENLHETGSEGTGMGAVQNNESILETTFSYLPFFNELFNSN